MKRVWILRGLVVLALWLVVCTTVGVANALTMKQFNLGDYVLGSIVATVVMVMLVAATLGAYELIKRIK